MNDLQTQWIDALRGGRYAQTRSKLKDHHDGFCCLGVLCDIVDSNSWYYDEHHGYYHSSYYGDASGYIPHAMAEAVGLFPEDISRLARYNDNGASFDAIADALEDRFVNATALPTLRHPVG